MTHRGRWRNRPLRKVLAAIAAGVLLLTFAVGGASAANPHRSYVLSACYDTVNATPVLVQTWSGFNVDSYDFGFSSAGGGFGIVPQPVGPAKTGTVNSSGLVADDTLTSGGGDLFWHGRVVATATMDQPNGGWETLQPC